MFRFAAVLIAGLVLLGACTDSDDSETASGGESAGAEEAGTGSGGEPARGGTLVAAISEDPGHLNPAITTSGATHTASELVYNGLVSLDEELRPVPELAESWEVEEDGALYRFHLREDVTWHDGEPFTAEDVVFTFEEVLLELHSRTKASLGGVLESVTAVDEHTVELRFDRPYAPLLQQLDVTEAPILAQHVYEGTNLQEAPANLEPVGTGPFELVSYRPDAELRFERNDDYFEEGLPYLDEVVMRVIPDASNQVVALEAGEVDWIWSVPGPDIERMRQAGGVELLETSVNPGGANCIMTVSFNLDRPMFQDVRTRRAVALALDRRQFLERVEFGQGKVAEAPISSGIPFAHAPDLEGMPGHDPEEAARLLEEAGWVRAGDGWEAEDVEGVEPGTPLAFDFLHFPQFSGYGDLVRAQLGELGVDVELRSLEPPVFVETVFTERDFDSNVVSYCNATDPEIGVRRMYISSNIGPIPFSNSSAYSNEEIDRLFDEARAEVDRGDRRGIYRRIQEILVRDVPYYWLVESVSTRAHTSDCSGFGPAGHFAKTARCER